MLNSLMVLKLDIKMQILIQALIGFFYGGFLSIIGYPIPTTEFWIGLCFMVAMQLTSLIRHE